MNMTNTNFRLADCNGAHDIYHEMEYGFIGPSIFFDFFAGFVSLEFTVKMYQGIDISHPVYSVVFSNNALSTFISFAKFISLLFATKVQIYPYAYKASTLEKKDHTNQYIRRNFLPPGVFSQETIQPRPVAYNTSLAVTIVFQQIDRHIPQRYVAIK